MGRLAEELSFLFSGVARTGFQIILFDNFALAIVLVLALLALAILFAHRESDDS